MRRDAHADQPAHPPAAPPPPAPSGLSLPQTVNVPTLPALSFQLFTLFVALNNAYFLRKAMCFDVHWVRAFTTLAVLSLGGASLAAALRGEPVPALSGTAIGNGQLMAVALAYMCVVLLATTAPPCPSAPRDAPRRQQRVATS